MPVNEVMGEEIFRQAVEETRLPLGPLPETGPPELDTGEEILALLAHLAWLVPMQRARLQLMENLPEHQRTEQRRWLNDLEKMALSWGTSTAFHQHNLRKAGYSSKSLSITP